MFASSGEQEGAIPGLFQLFTGQLALLLGGGGEGKAGEKGVEGEGAGEVEAKARGEGKTGSVFSRPT